ncbi:MAG TPA: CmcJ/NvfI family oxidoreductase [Stellaceae bacterium]
MSDTMIAGDRVQFDVPMRFIDPDAAPGFVYLNAYDQNTMKFQTHRVVVTDARPMADNFILDRNGFALVRRPTEFTQFDDPARAEAVYYPEIAALVREVLGAEKVLVFHPALRRDVPSSRQRPARNAHLDYPVITYRRWAEQLMGADAAAEWLQRRFVGINIWRPLKPVLASPLAVCDGATLSTQDLRIGYAANETDNTDPRATFNLAYNPAQRWYYFRHMRPDEVLLIKIADSDASRVQGAPHSAIDDPTSAPDAPPRESYEIRALAFMPA